MKLLKTSRVRIVMPQEASLREKFAAEELEKYLRAILPGIQVSAACEAAPDAAVILLGHPGRNSAAAKYISPQEFDALVPGPEGIFLRTFDDNTLLIAGSKKNAHEWERGTIYAVYELLERFCGCCFAGYMNSEVSGGEYIPELSVLDLSCVDYIKPCADLEFRCATAQYLHGDIPSDHKLTIPFLDWLAKNRYNRIYTWASVYETWKSTGLLHEALRRGFRFVTGHHDSIRTFIPTYGNSYFPEHYAETHPEFFRLQEDGTRFIPTDFWGQWIFCSNNSELIETISRNIITWSRQNPAVDIVNIGPQDGRAPQCCCEACKKHTKVENYIHFVCQVAQRVAAECPHISIRSSAYADLWDCPEGIRIPGNVIVNESMWNATGTRLIGKPDGSCVLGTDWERDILRWKATGAKVIYYEYYMGTYPARQRWMPSADEIQALWRGHKEQGIFGVSTQIECYNFWNNAFNFYCFARTGYDNELSFDINLVRFCRIFGEGAPFVEEIIRIGEEVLDGQVNVGKAGMYVAEHIDKDRVYKLYDKALNAASTKFYRNNVRMMRLAWRYTDLECQTTLQHGGASYETWEKCSDPTGELDYMSRHFDSGLWNNPGFGIMLPLMCEKTDVDFSADVWYHFE